MMVQGSKKNLGSVILRWMRSKCSDLAHRRQMVLLQYSGYCFVPHLLQKLARAERGAPQFVQNFSALIAAARETTGPA